jgi:hypothetical protein
MERRFLIQQKKTYITLMDNTRKLPNLLTKVKIPTEIMHLHFVKTQISTFYHESLHVNAILAWPVYISDSF